MCVCVCEGGSEGVRKEEKDRNIVVCRKLSIRTTLPLPLYMLTSWFMQLHIALHRFMAVAY